jgi:omega-6 fatty acid desaturase (delta-12 desaturase)
MLGFLSFTCTLLLWCLSLVGVIYSPWWLSKVIFGIINGNAISLMFLVGHEACHGVLLPKKWMNSMAGKIALAPAFHSRIAWIHTHNYLHHKYTNIKEMDPSIAPWDIKDYLKLSPFKQLEYRASRTVYGLGWLHFKEMWVKWIFFPIKSRASRRYKAFLKERMALFLFFIMWIALLVWSAVFRAESIWLMVVCGFVIPQMIWNWLMAFVILQQHTHPDVARYSSLDFQLPSSTNRQLNSTPHLIFPSFLKRSMFHIMEHTAHHLDPSVPFYQLEHAQQHIDKNHPDDIVSEPLTLSSFLKTITICKLYNYETHQYVDYEGNPTTKVLYNRSA